MGYRERRRWIAVVVGLVAAWLLFGAVRRYWPRHDPAMQPPARLTYLRDPLWSPRGDSIAFLTAGAKSLVGELWLARARGPARAQELLSWPVIFIPEWRPDGSGIVVGSVGVLWLVKVGGAMPVPVRLAEGAFFSDPDWSPDGRRLAWVRSRFSTSRPRYEVKVAEVTGDRLGSPVSLDSFWTPLGLHWSRDGRRLLYVDADLRESALRPCLDLVNRDGHGWWQLGPLPLYDPAWCGPYEVEEVHTVVHGDKCRVLLVSANVDTGDVSKRAIAEVPRAAPAPFDSRSSWTRDRSAVLLVAGAEDYPQGASEEEGDKHDTIHYANDQPGSIYVVDLVTKQAVPLTTDGEDEDPAWSPNASEIAFVRHTPGAQPGQPGTDSLWVMKADGSGQRKVLDAADLPPGQLTPPRR